jgi:hypothetical protein
MVALEWEKLPSSLWFATLNATLTVANIHFNLLCTVKSALTVANHKLEGSYSLIVGIKTYIDLRCQLCKYNSDTESFSSPVTGHNYRKLGNFSYKPKNWIYLISVDVCHKQYLGATADFCKRINIHRYSIRTKKRHSPVGGHINNGYWQWPQVVWYRANTKRNIVDAPAEVLWATWHQQNCRLHQDKHRSILNFTWQPFGFYCLIFLYLLKLYSLTPILYPKFQKYLFSSFQILIILGFIYLLAPLLI